MNIDSLPRVKLATLPTPLDELPRLSNELGIRVLMKRDDLTGFALGGNKARKLEFLLADAIQQGADTLVTSGGPQSNHARMSAAAARRAGMNCKLLFFGTPPQQANGNLLLDELLGAETAYAGTDDKNEAERLLSGIADELKARGRKPYVIPAGGSTALGCASYILAVGELLDQLKAASVTPDWIFITTGSCGTHAGVLSGKKYFNSSIPIYGISVSRSKAECLQRIPILVQKTADLLEHPLPLEAGDVIVNADYLGPGYSIITPAAREAIYKVAQLEGIFLDPVYTGKTMAGLFDLVERGEIKHSSTIVFWHTGGTPGIFGFPQDFQKH